MRKAKKLTALMLLAAFVFAFIVPVSAMADTTTQATTGSITIKDSSTVKVEGREFKAYKILDVKSFTEDKTDATTGEVTKGHVVYTVPEAMKSFYNTKYSLTGNEADYDAQVVQKISEEKDMFAFAAEALAAAKTAKVVPGSATGAEKATSVTINSLPLGYYVVEDASGEKPVSALILDTTNLNPEVAIKADQPKVEKKIDGKNDTDPNTDKDVKYNNASVGDTVPYKLTSHVPDMTGYEHYYFVLTDTMSKGLTYDEKTGVTITITKTVKEGDTEKTVTEKLVKDQDFSVTYTKNTNDDGTAKDSTLEIVFKNFIKYNTEEYKNAPIEISYSATINKDAEIGVAGNPNAVKLTYSNNPNVKEEGNPGDKPGDKSPVGETTEEKTYTYVTGVKLIKVDPEGNLLTGAEFEISGTRANTVLVKGEAYVKDPEGSYWELKDGTYTTDDPSTPGMKTDKYVDIDTKYVKVEKGEFITKGTEAVQAKGFVNENGEIEFTGLAAGEYTITELKAPNGYNKLSHPINLTIDFTAPAEDATETNGTWTYTWKQNDKTLTAEAGVGNVLKVENNTGTELPETGGIGTTIFYVVGAALVLGAGVLLVTKKRMTGQR